MRLKPKEVAGYRERRLKQQRGKCGLCGKPVKKDQATLDHDHTTGHVRSVLHRHCNQVEGRVLKWAKSSYMAPDEFLKALLRYWNKDYSNNPVHPNHRTMNEQEIKRLKRRMKKLKRESTKHKYRQKIRELQNEE